MHMLARKEVLSDIETLLEKIDYRISQPSPIQQAKPLHHIESLWRMVSEACEALELDIRGIDYVEMDYEIWQDAPHMSTYTIEIAGCCAIFDHRGQLFFTGSYEYIERLQDVASELEKDKNE